VVYVRDDRGWYYRYSHLHTIDQAIKPGTVVKLGGRIGLLGKEGGSGGWSHLHFDISAMQPSGRFGIVEAYAFVWQVYRDKQNSQLQAVARPITWSGPAKPSRSTPPARSAARGPKALANMTGLSPTARRPVVQRSSDATIEWASIARSSR
jgi:murein DD-endopeptidase MepM/ murein hydrolase activator NlpD